MRAHSNLHLTYWSLLSVTFVSSCFLFFVVATEHSAVPEQHSVTIPEDAVVLANDGQAPRDTADQIPPAQQAPKVVEKPSRPPELRIRKSVSHEPATESVAFVVGASEPAPTEAKRSASTSDSSSDSKIIVDDVAAVASRAAETTLRDSVASEVPVGLEPAMDVEVASLTSQAPEEQQTNGDESLPELAPAPEALPDQLLAPSPTPASGTQNADLPGLNVENMTLAEVLNAAGVAVEIVAPTEEHSIKFDDSGGDEVAADVAAAAAPADNIPSDSSAATSVGNDSQTEGSATTEGSGGTRDEATANRTLEPAAEEVPMPVFSEWAQQQMAEQQALEQEVVNTNAKNHTNGGGNGGKAPPLKLRAKNYASPDCGAKIIASNADASNTGAVLSSSKDEYMLSPCGNRIWFVVELCEAIQAQKIDLANFELFSSSPRNFTVAVSNRFPTRDWSNVGRFIAEDKRTVQSFDLQPHLFGKFVRVDIHSHYAKEHFCPVSLFRVFGTSEFEAFETENQPHDGGDLDDFDEEAEQAQARTQEQPNLFKSASDAVMSIVKKAAEALAKPVSGTQNNSLLAGGAAKSRQHHDAACLTPAFTQFSCSVAAGGDCSRALAERINALLSCELPRLMELLHVRRLRQELRRTGVCATHFGIETSSDVDCQLAEPARDKPLSMRPSYLLNWLPSSYLGALCQLLAIEQRASTLSAPTSVAGSTDAGHGEVSLNLTIDKKAAKDDFKLEPKDEKRPLPPSAHLEPALPPVPHAAIPAPLLRETDTPAASPEAETLQTQVPRSSEPDGDSDTTTTTTLTTPAPPTPPPSEPAEPTEPAVKRDVVADVNIFNVPPPAADSAEEVDEEHWTTQAPPPPLPEETASTASLEQLTASAGETDASNAGDGQEPLVTGTANEALPNRGEEDVNSWDNLERLLSQPSTVAPNAASDSIVGASIGGAANGNGGVKAPNGGPQSESIFIRLSNRIKALERNMSLSGQYLEELSRRYKKQVEELQQSLTQQTQTVRVLEEHSRRHGELEQMLAQRNSQLRSELDDLTLQVHACIVVIIFVGAFVLLVLMAGILCYRALRREARELVGTLTGVAGKRKTTAGGTTCQQKRPNRRKSFDDFDQQQQSNGVCEKQRRPSEEAMLILKDCGGDLQHHNGKGDSRESSFGARPSHLRQRKISVCYGGTVCNAIGQAAVGGASQGEGKRKGAKLSWPQGRVEQRQRTVWHRHEAFFDLDTLQPAKTAAAQSENGGGTRGQKKKVQHFKRQESAPSRLPTVRLNVTAPAELQCNATAADYSDMPLDEEDLDNFIPNADLAYNEFMPDGPSGYQTVTDAPHHDNGDATTALSAANSKARRLTVATTNFFKSPFGKSLKTKAVSVPSTKLTAPHESTSWEWYRSHKKPSSPASAPVGLSAAQLRASPALSLDSASLSEFNFPTNGTSNSYRILEEAILSSGEVAASPAATNGNGYGHSSGSGGSGSSNRSSTSTSSSNAAGVKAKKQQRSFNRIFRKVF